jgi:hypothetical protein
MILHRIILTFCLTIFAFCSIDAQKQKVTLKDSLDNKLDLGNYIIHAHGIVPVPVVITEPALGNLGLAIGLLYIQPKKELSGERKYRSPDITGLLGWHVSSTSGWASMWQQARDNSPIIS